MTFFRRPELEIQRHVSDCRSIARRGERKREQVDDVRSGLLVLEGLELDGLDAHSGGWEVRIRVRMRMEQKKKQWKRL